MGRLASLASGALRPWRHLAWWALAGALQAGAAFADSPGEGALTWGNEEDGGHLVLEVPFSTPHRERVEVVVAVDYMDPRFGERETMMREWRGSLPDTVDLLRVPVVWKRGEEDAERRVHRHHHRQALLAARILGIEDRVHAALVEALGPAPFDIGTDARVRSLVLGQGAEASAYEAALRSPLLHAREWEGAILSAGLQSATAAPAERGGVPWLLVNGRYVTGSRRAGSAAAAFRVANRLIRETLESGPPFHRGPRDIPELIERLEEWSGEHLVNAAGGRFKGVYNPWRRELWSLNDAGEVRGIARERQGSRRVWEWLDLESGRRVPAMNWRAGFHYAPREPRERHAAFVLADWLSRGQEVELSFKSRPVGLSFAAEGRVEARSAQGPVRGSWWLEAAALHVSLGEYGIASWPWREAARQVGFEAPSVAIAPWRTN